MVTLRLLIAEEEAEAVWVETRVLNEEDRVEKEGIGEENTEETVLFLL